MVKIKKTIVDMEKKHRQTTEEFEKKIDQQRHDLRLKDQSLEQMKLKMTQMER